MQYMKGLSFANMCVMHNRVCAALWDSFKGELKSEPMTMKFTVKCDLTYM